MSDHANFMTTPRTGATRESVDGNMDEQKPICPECGGRHWLLEPCVDGKGVVTDRAELGPCARSANPDTAGPPATLGALGANASADEIERALKFYRAHRVRQRERMRRRRAAAQGVVAPAP